MNVVFVFKDINMEPIRVDGSYYDISKFIDLNVGNISYMIDLEDGRAHNLEEFRSKNILFKLRSHLQNEAVILVDQLEKNIYEIVRKIKEKAA
jgi:hypothetical protein